MATSASSSTSNSPPSPQDSVTSRVSSWLSSLPTPSPSRKVTLKRNWTPNDTEDGSLNLAIMPHLDEESIPSPAKPDRSSSKKRRVADESRGTDDYIESSGPPTAKTQSSNRSKKLTINDIKYIDPQVLFYSSEEYYTKLESLQPPKVTRLQDIIRIASDRSDVIPISVKAKLEERLTSTGQGLPEDSVYQQSHNYSNDEAIEIYLGVVQIKQDAQFERRSNAHEVNVGDNLVAKLLDLVCRRSEFGQRVYFRNLTSAKIQPVGICPTDNQKIPVNRHIDYVVHLSLSEEEEKMVDKAFLLLKQEDRSLNQTLSVPLRPIFLAAEIKRSYGFRTDPRVQLGVWFAAGVKKRAHHKWDQSTPGVGLAVDGEHVQAFISFWDEDNSKLIMLGPEFVGSFSTEVAIFKLVFTLMAIVRWGHSTFQADFERDVMSSLRTSLTGG